MLARTPSNAEVISSIAVSGRLSARRYAYVYLNGTTSVPIRARTVELVVIDRAEHPSASVASQRAAAHYLVSRFHARTLVHRNGVWELEWSAPSTHSSIEIPNHSRLPPVRRRGSSGLPRTHPEQCPAGPARAARMSRLVRARGLEPPPPCGDRDLNPARLPVPPRPQRPRRAGEQGVYGGVPTGPPPPTSLVAMANAPRTPPITAAGADLESAGRVYQRLLKERIVFIGSAIDQNTANVVCAQLILLEAEDHERTSRSTSTRPAGRSPTAWPSTTPCSTCAPT